jgi:hypothetical protein
VISQQDLVDSYLPPFQACVEQGEVTSLMCSYNRYEGSRWQALARFALPPALMADWTRPASTGTSYLRLQCQWEAKLCQSVAAPDRRA